MHQNHKSSATPCSYEAGPAPQAGGEHVTPDEVEVFQLMSAASSSRFLARALLLPTLLPRAVCDGEGAGDHGRELIYDEILDIVDEQGIGIGGPTERHGRCVVSGARKRRWTDARGKRFVV